MKDDSKNKKPSISREAWLRLAGKRDSVDPSEYDDFSKDAIEGLQHVPDEQALRATLGKLDKRLEALAASPPAPPRSRRRFLNKAVPWAKAAAVIALLAATAGIYFFLQPSTNASQQLYNAYFEPVGSAIPGTGLRKASDQARPERAARARALQLYEQGAFEQALPHFEHHLSRSPSDADVRFYYGITLMGAGQHAAAISELQRATAEATSAAYRSGSRWYLSLALLKTGATGQAKMQLQTLLRESDERSSYHRQAAALWRDLQDQ